MGSIRKQTIISSVLIYIGFLIGFVNQYLYTLNGSFTVEQYALTRIFFDFAQNMVAFGALGVIPVIYKFYPYYKDNLEQEKIDLMIWAMIAAVIGFIIVLASGLIFQPYFVKKFIERSPLIVQYYYWMFPFAMGMLFFSVIEGFCWALQLSVISNFLKETVFRIITCILILLFYFKLISFQVFIYLFAFQFLAIFLFLFIYLIKTNNLHFNFSISRVTKKFWKKMLSMQVLLYGGTLIASIAATIDSFIIASILGLKAVGIFVFAQYIANVLQVPQRSIQAVSSSFLSRAWKDKNYPEINRIYSRSCINLLIMSLFLFGNIWLNVKEGITVLNIQNDYLDGMKVLFILSMVRVIDAGTGLNAMVINTSTFWRFDFISGVVLIGLRFPLTYYLIKQYGIVGSAIAELVAYGIYNFIRYEFLRRKFNMQPFNLKTVYVILLSLTAYGVCYFAFSQFSGWTSIFLNGIVFSVIMIGGVFYLKLTPDAMQLYHVVRNKWKKDV
ncbi:oligosaccharide flippase family protein [Sediminibacterium sp.]|uniref:lipopolysaccharide biosynthesis protein n=1 Tax=Sediminibacterium sp. TaxID=1917865 RepID=UPI0025EEDEA2|nr:oligosaccharide flippase family protein [Sediminibacterium sp.]MBW0178239.1 oligosaccharide flippase family protein [Sediminibacterium sp.]